MSAPVEDFWSTLPIGQGVGLLTRDGNGLVAFSKPAGVLSHPNAPGDEPRALLTASYAMDGEFFSWTDAQGEARRLWLLNRLDSATSGVILAAAEGELASEVRAQFKKKRVRKIYYALLFGAPAHAVELWRDLLAVDKRGGKIRTAAHAGHIPAETQMSVMRARRTEPRLVLVRLEPRTGRSHQLRVQCAKRGVPIAGDQTYGDFPRNREFAKLAGTKRLFLHSLETSFTYDWRGQTFPFSAKAPLPAEFDKFL